uniref:Uncharacterized protein n=1 Tax=Chromera velia CCMP2878 TaxID=1169474 RepID=A0A0G4F408_9ALVE|eukprot:Cvel_14909.t1-p1 / transcript=Cvel_14909.t1 / gene=Cvel_14909 / organism=Chromera_velia_CCMP2878 / gene_product=Tenascin, putative / transcript_product=Tenascin, putative / location=Cvel_scaffold1080:34561-35776(+) / protein_length=364 / sequence_SO=supercontig / SO=protein_coding / is_pseudo=false
METHESFQQEDPVDHPDVGLPDLLPLVPADVEMEDAQAEEGDGRGGGGLAEGGSDRQAAGKRQREGLGAHEAPEGQTGGMFGRSINALSDGGGGDGAFASGEASRGAKSRRLSESGDTPSGSAAAAAAARGSAANRKVCEHGRRSVGGGIFVFMDGSGEGAVNVAAGTFVRTIGSALLARSAGDVEFVRTIAAAMSARTVGGAESVSMESAVIGASLVARKRACPPTAAKLSHVKKRGGGVVPVFMGRLKQIVRIVSSAESASMVSVVISVRTAYVRASASMAVSVPNAHNAAAGANMVGFLLYAESAGQIFVYTERGVEMSARSVEAVASASTEFAVTDAKSVRGTVCVSTDGDVTVAGSVGV